MNRSGTILVAKDPHLGLPAHNLEHSKRPSPQCKSRLPLQPIQNLAATQVPYKGSVKAHPLQHNIAIRDQSVHEAATASRKLPIYVPVMDGMDTSHSPKEQDESFDDHEYFHDDRDILPPSRGGWVGNRHGDQPATSAPVVPDNHLQSPFEGPRPDDTMANVTPFVNEKPSNAFQVEHRVETGPSTATPSSLLAPQSQSSVPLTNQLVHVDSNDRTLRDTTNTYNAPTKQPHATAKHRVSGNNDGEKLATGEVKNAVVDSHGDPEWVDYPKTCPAYVEDIFAHYLKIERELHCSLDYMDQQKNITSVMRTILVDWLADISYIFKVSHLTLYRSIDYLDRVLSVTEIGRSNLQLLGATCLFLASKLEDVYPPDIQDFVLMSDFTFTKNQVVRMEEYVLKALDFRLHSITPHHYLYYFLCAASPCEDTMCTTKYCVELSLLDDTFLKYMPSQVVAGAIALSRALWMEKKWSSALEARTGYSPEDLQGVVGRLFKLLRQSPDMRVRAIPEKYSKGSQRYRAIATRVVTQIGSSRKPPAF